jgi:NADPH2:quinone reductase
MKAAYLENPGPPDVLKYADMPTPEPKAGEIRVKIAAASLNPIDTYIRAGVVAMPLPKPFITGSDAAGTIDAVGPGAKRFNVGDRVWGSNQGLLGRQGSCAEYVCASEEFFYATPAGVSDEQAAAAALVGITAHLGLIQRARLQPGETVFVNGGTGGVGSMVVQMAKAIGARAITTVGSAEKAALCKSWGVDCVLNYKTDDIPARIKEFTADKGVNVWYETQREPSFEKMIPLMTPRGRMIVMAGRQAKPTFPVGPFYVKDLSLFGFAMFNSPSNEQRQCADDISRWLAEKKLQVPIGRRFRISEAAQAHAFLEDNTLKQAGTLVGKVVLTP